jgi:hypothetical protein
MSKSSFMTNSSFPLHDPDNQMIIAYVLIGVGSLIGLVEVIAFKKSGLSVQTQKRICTLTNQFKQLYHVLI